MRAEAVFNEAQQRRLLASAGHADKLLGDIEQILRAAESKSPFPKYQPDVAPHQARLLYSHIARFRSHLSRVLAAAGVRHDRPQFSSLHSIRVTLAFVRIAVQEMAPEYLRGYGELPEAAGQELRGLCSELEGLLNGLDRNLALGAEADLAARIDRLDPAIEEKELLRRLDRIATELELAEFRAPLLHLVEKAESREFEIAVFGRVSSGKSSLLNHILGVDVLPVGVNPITTVPVRLFFGAEPRLEVSFAGGQRTQGALSELERYASEERNPGNELGVIRLAVELPSPRLEGGLVLVDTPGLGALATAGAAETLAYLPRCDLGIVLVSAVNPIDEEDLGVIESLAHAGIPVLAVLSKADLLAPEDLGKALEYTEKQVQANLGLRIGVSPVSTRPSHAALLDTWFRDHLAPLEGRHRELVRESIRRKAGAVRERVVAALRASLGGDATMPESDPAKLEEAERTLREAAAEIEQTRRWCLEATDHVRGLGAEAFRQAAAGFLAAQRRGNAPADSTPLVEAVNAVAVEAAAATSDRLRSLARNLDSALGLAASALGNDQIPSEGSLEQLVREMPRCEAALDGVAIRAPWFSFLGAPAEAWLARRLRQQAGGAVQAAFNHYGRSLERWVRRVLTDLHTQFEAEADSHRAQLARLTRREALPPEQRKKIERALAELEAAVNLPSH
jgi:GTP-binding protein EngB required for normal cell division